VAGYNPLALPIDSIILGGLASPGIARVIGAASRRKVDVRGAYGISATVAVWLEVAEFKVEIELWTDEDWELWDVWSAATVLQEIKANRRNSAKKFALDIWHPWLDMLDIKSVIVKSVSQPEEIHPTVWKVTIDFIEYRQAQLTLSKPEAAKTKEQDAIARLQDQQSKRITELVQQLAALDNPP
jgi:hypothetical protein